MNNIKISLIIVTYNSRDLIIDCIKSIYKYTDIPVNELEIIVVDNSSEEEGRKMHVLLEEHFRSKIIFVKSVNVGYGSGNNIGIENSRGSIIAIMNPDVRFESSLLKDVFEKFKNKNLALLGYKQKGGFDFSFYLKPEYRNSFTGFITKITNKIDVFSQKYFYLSGAFFFIDRNKFMEIGFFDENIFMYFEEPDIAKRIREKKYTVCYDNSKTYLHLVGNRTDWSEKAFGSEIKSLKYYLQKFNFNEKRIINNYLAEYKFKIFVAKILKDQNRLNKFKNEVLQIKNIFKK
ncbi:glycosyltransferase family 2 protein [Halpernia sp. GG3]